MRLFTCLLFTLSTLPLYAAPATQPSCAEWVGSWSGTYHDTTALFSPATQAVQLVVTRHGAHLLGYTLPPTTTTPTKAHTALAPYHAAVLYASCHHGVVSALALIPDHSVCANFIADPHWQLTAPAQLSFATHWESPMMDTNFRFELKRDTISPSLNAHRLAYAQSLVLQPRPHCH